MHQQALAIETTAPLPPIAQAAADLVQLGIVPLRVKHRGKAPTANAWQQTAMPSMDDVPRQFAGQCNLGALLGAPSADLVDVDLDWPEAGQLAAKLLPASWCYGWCGIGRSLKEAATI
ncbi:MAG: bifunctional DNA primase/polymerase [Lamprobacter sp.]|uniref:bifunctional DNA primase/polymerase n=1 Tax=Lamprobacter sp. TaxID=3100796 RepID=UPI002B25AAE6|nr:bifunctional DNA primase/polymerase [Lamprobacter sp.]MEA3638735.1 bifunctional DNA primase/polymerase [Lamprobacter sp.]